MSDDTQLIVLCCKSASTIHRFSVSRTQFQISSAFYCALVTSGMADANQTEICVPDVTENGLLSIVNYVKQPKKWRIDSHLMNEVVAAACYLQMNDLLDDCSKLLILNLSRDTWLDTLLLSHCYILTAVRTAVYKYVVRRFCHRPKLLSRSALSKLTLEDICSIIDDDDISVKEKEIFDVAYLWLKCCKKVTSQAAPTVLSMIRFSLMSAEDLQHCLDQMAALSVPVETYSHLFEEAKHYVADPKNCSTDERKTRARCLVDVVMALGGFTTTEHSSSRMQLLRVQDFISSSEKTHENDVESVGFRQCQSARLPNPLCEHASCVVRNVLYIAGGQKRYNCDGRHTSREVYSFDPRLCTWNVCSPMNVPRSLFYLGELDDQIYAVAGWTAVNEDTSTVERYSPDTDTWHRMSDFPTDVHEHAGCKRDGKLYVSGGFRGPFHGHIDKFYCYTAELDQWEELAPLNTARSYHVMAATARHIAVIGGVHYDNIGDVFHDLQSCELYDPTVNQWTLILGQCLPFFSSCAPSVVFEGAEGDGVVHVALLGGHSFADDTDHSMLQVVRFAGDMSSPRVDCTVATSTINTRRVQYSTLNVLKLPARYVDRFH